MAKLLKDWKMVHTKLSMLIAVFSVVASGYVLADSIEMKFEERYVAWKRWIAANAFRSTYTACREYYDIMALGIPAIPLMIGKMENRFDDFHLSTAVGIISKREFDDEEWPDGRIGDSIISSRMYIHWWRIGRFQTKMRFDGLYAQWCELASTGNVIGAKNAYRQIVNLGLPVLPYLVGIVHEHAEFVAAISGISDGALPSTATAEECEKWWEENKSAYTLPGALPDGSQAGSGCDAALNQFDDEK